MVTLILVTKPTFFWFFSVIFCRSVWFSCWFPICCLFFFVIVNFDAFLWAWSWLFGSRLLPLARCNCCTYRSCALNLGCLSDKLHAFPHVGGTSAVGHEYSICFLFAPHFGGSSAVGHDLHMFLLGCTCWRSFRCRSWSASPRWRLSCWTPRKHV